MFAWLSDQMTTRNEEWCERSISTNEMKSQRKQINWFDCVFDVFSLFVFWWVENGLDDVIQSYDFINDIMKQTYE